MRDEEAVLRQLGRGVFPSSARGFARKNLKAALRASLLVALAGVTQTLPALDPSFALSQYAKKHWQVEQGLPQNYVTSITQNAAGHLLVGTSGGAARFDGLRFSTITLESDSGLSREWVNLVAEDSSGRVWMFSRDEGAFALEHGRSARARRELRVVTSALTLRDGAMAVIAGNVWRMRDGELRSVFEPGGVDLRWQGLAELPNGDLLVCASRGVFSIGREGHISTIAARNDALGSPLSVLAGADGQILIGTTRGLFTLRAADSKTATPPLRVKGVEGPVVNIVRDRDGLVWVATWGNGLYRVHESRVDRWAKSDGLADDFVHSLFEDREGSLWIGTRAGLSRWRSGPIIPHGPPEGLDALFVSSVAGSTDGRLWIGTWREGVHRYTNGQFQRLPVAVPMETTLIHAIGFGKDGGAWFSDWSGQLHYFNGRAETVYSASRLGIGSNVRAIHFDRKGGLWLGAQNGLYYYPDGGVEGSRAMLLEARDVRTLLETRDGTMWAGSNHGLAVIRGSRIEEIAGLPHPAVTALAEDSRGNVWAGTRANGLLLVKGRKARVFDQRQGLPELPVYAILEDHFERLWLSTPAGLFVIPLGQLERLASGVLDRVMPMRFDSDAGLRSSEFQNVGDPSAWRDADGHLWFATVAGLVEVQPEKLHIPDPPSVLLKSVSSGDGRHEITFTTDRLNGAPGAEFRYRIEGLQPGWISLGSQRVLRLDTLPPGLRRVEISARQAGSDWGASGVAVIEQAPRWYQSGWFYAVCAGVLGALLWLIYQWRLHFVRARYALVAEERNRIGREWHDTLLAGFSALSWQLDSARKALDRNSGAAARDAILTAGGMLRHYRRQARQAIWDLRYSSPEREPLIEALRRTMREIIPGEIAHSVEFDGDSEKVSGDISHAALRICQEAALNAARHAEARNIAIRVRVTEGYLLASVKDDGNGFEPAAVGAGHFGISILKERAAHAGGTVDIVSTAGEGTRVTLKLPLNGRGRG